MAENSTPTKRRTKVAKPKKPHPDFPLTANGNGQWSKKIRGKVHYFGSWADPYGALDKYLDRKDDLLAGRTPRSRDGLTVGELANHFLTIKKQLVDSGELKSRSWNDYKSTCDRVVSWFSKNRLVEDLAVADFEEFRGELAKTRGPVAIGNEVQRTRTLFKYGFDNDLLQRPVKFGTAFKRPSKKVRRTIRNEQGPRMFEAADIHALLDAANSQFKAMVLLGINCGFGNSDIATLPLDRIDLNSGWHNFGRPKTGVARRCPLWSQTIKALSDVVASRPSPQNQDDAHLVFLTKRGQPYVRLQQRKSTDETANEHGHMEATTWIDAISRQCRKILNELGLKRDRLNFYSLRRTFRTIGDEAGDQPAVNFMMGHADNDSDMGNVYRQRINDDRLEQVANYVRAWLWSNGE